MKKHTKIVLYNKNSPIVKADETEQSLENRVVLKRSAIFGERTVTTRPKPVVPKKNAIVIEIDKISDSYQIFEGDFLRDEGKLGKNLPEKPKNGHTSQPKPKKTTPPPAKLAILPETKPTVTAANIVKEALVDPVVKHNMAKVVYQLLQDQKPTLLIPQQKMEQEFLDSYAKVADKSKEIKTSPFFNLVLPLVDKGEDKKDGVAKPEIEIVDNNNNKVKLKVNELPYNERKITKVPNPFDKDFREKLVEWYKFTRDYQSGYAPAEQQHREEREIATSYKQHFIKK
jgi:hypothetical protein